MALDTSVVTNAWNWWADGASRKSDTKAFAIVPELASVFVTTTSCTVPGSSAGAVAVRMLKFVTFTPGAGTPPTVTVAPSRTSVPVIVRNSPPAGSPDAGLRKNGILCENSDVRPTGSVAVAVIRAPVSTVTGSVTSIATTPDASVST